MASQGFARRARMLPKQVADQLSAPSLRPQSLRSLLENQRVVKEFTNGQYDPFKALGMLLIKSPGAGPKLTRGGPTNGRNPSTRMSVATVSQLLGAVQVTPLIDGYASGAPVTLSSFWEKKGAVVFAVRRPG